MIKINQLYNENCIETMKRMPDEFVDMVLTSPPYDNRRTYGNIHKFDFNEFKIVAKELYRIMKPGRVIVWVVNDETKDYCESLTSFKQAIYFVDECGFNLLDTMIYYKKSTSAPFHVIIKTRYSPSFEYMFIFCKDKPLVFNPLKERCKTFGFIRKGSTERQINGKLLKIKKKLITKEFKVKTNVWKILSNDNTDNKENDSIHPAVFPKQLVIDHIKSWSNEDDLIFDPFSGSGTVAKVSKLMNRNFIGSEINKEYFDLSNLTLKRTDLRKKGSEIYGIR